MDTEERVARLEARVDAHGQNSERLQSAIDKLTVHTDNGFAEQRQAMAELRTYVDKRFDDQQQAMMELRNYVDKGFSEQREAMAELRREASINMRWMVGLWMTNTAMIMGVAGKVFGFY